jgi:hypothetical protein
MIRVLVVDAFELGIFCSIYFGSMEYTLHLPLHPGQGSHKCLAVDGNGKG